MARMVTALVLPVLVGCVSVDRTMSDLVGQPRSVVVERFGNPTHENYYPSIYACKQPEKPVGLLSIDSSYSGASEDGRCPVFMRPAFANVSNALPVTMLTFNTGTSYNYTLPTTARTTVYGNTAYTTISPGGEYTRDTRCRIDVALVREKVSAYELTGEGCQ